MSQVNVNAGGINMVLDFGNKSPLPTLDPVLGIPWQQYGYATSPYHAVSAAQPGTFDNQSTNPQALPVVFKNPA
jgi:phage tail protein X